MCGGGSATREDDGRATYGTFLSQKRLFYQEENSEYMDEFKACN